MLTCPCSAAKCSARSPELSFGSKYIPCCAHPASNWPGPCNPHRRRHAQSWSLGSSNAWRLIEHTRESKSYEIRELETIQLPHFTWAPSSTSHTWSWPPKAAKCLNKRGYLKTKMTQVYLSLKPSSVRATFETGIADTFLTWSSSTIQAKAQWRCPAGFVCWIQFRKCAKGLLGHSLATQNWAREVKRSEVVSATSGSFGLAEEIAQRPSKFLTDLQCFSSHRTT